MAETLRRDVNESDIDWGSNEYPLGMRRPDGLHEGRWNPLTRADCEVLSKLLRTALPLRHADGHIELVRAVDESQALRDLADWAHAVADFMRRRGL